MAKKKKQTNIKKQITLWFHLQNTELKQKNIFHLHWRWKKKTKIKDFEDGYTEKQILKSFWFFFLFFISVFASVTFFKIIFTVKKGGEKMI